MQYLSIEEPLSLAATKAVVGIDFGTTNSFAAWIDPEDRKQGVQIIPLASTQAHLTSVVQYSSKGYHVGEEQRVEDPLFTIRSIKRCLADRFGEQARTRIRQAANNAGIRVAGVLSEPIAAALACNRLFEPNQGSTCLLVYDIGGGTFDASVLIKNGSLFEVVATTGDPALGGDDIDRALLDLLAERRSFASEEDGLRYARWVKERRGISPEMQVMVSEEEWKRLLCPFWEKSWQLLQLALLRSSFREQLLAHGISPILLEAPEEAVVRGAAIKAADIALSRRDWILIDVNPLPQPLKQDDFVWAILFKKR